MEVVELETEKTLYYCKACDYQFTVTVGTIFNDSHLPLTKWFMATLLLCEAKKGMSACQIQRTLGLGSYRTAWYLCHRIRAAMSQVDKPMLDGKVEVDETYVGGKGHGKRDSRTWNQEAACSWYSSAQRRTPIVPCGLFGFGDVSSQLSLYRP